MITDHRANIQELGFQRVTKARVSKQSKEIQKFRVPAELTFDATEYFEMIDLTDVVIKEPPKIKIITDSDLQNLLRCK